MNSVTPPPPSSLPAPVGGRRVVLALLVLTAATFGLIAISLGLRRTRGAMDPSLLWEGRFAGSWEHVGAPPDLSAWGIEGGTVRIRLTAEADGVTPPRGVFAYRTTAFGERIARSAEFELDPRTGVYGGALLFTPPDPGLETPGALEGRILLDLEAGATPAEDRLYLGFGRHGTERTVAMHAFRRADAGPE